MHKDDVYRWVKRCSAEAQVVMNAKGEKNGYAFLWNMMLEPWIQNVVEIGTHVGHSACYMAAGLDEHGGKLYTIEKDPKLYRCAEITMKAVQLTNVQCLCGDSLDVLPKLLAERQFQAAYIDGLHSYQQVKQELRLLLDHMKPQQRFLIMLDDVDYEHRDSKGDGGLPRLMKELGWPIIVRGVAFINQLTAIPEGVLK